VVPQPKEEKYLNLWVHHEIARLKYSFTDKMMQATEMFLLL